MPQEKYTKRQMELLFEAFRRNDLESEKEWDIPLVNRWLGLGTASAYKPGLSAGLFVFHDGKIPPKRCMGWLCLTEKGAAALEELTPQFQETLKNLKETLWYKSSYASKYTLAGGFTS